MNEIKDQNLMILNESELIKVVKLTIVVDFVTTNILKIGSYVSW